MVSVIQLSSPITTLYSFNSGLPIVTQRVETKFGQVKFGAGTIFGYKLIYGAERFNSPITTTYQFTSILREA